ncbi:MAG: DUF4157 domain-containing protein [Gammaproteobacteria bacterium]|nr:DUF4157 domain-containing protein [Gammaproteobacteria bacterium]
MHIKAAYSRHPSAGFRPGARRGGSGRQTGNPIGNLAMQGLLRHNSSPDHRTSHPTDFHERQADRIADQVMGGGNLNVPLAGAGRQTGSSGKINRKAGDSANSGSPSGGPDVFKSSGRPLSDSNRRFFESRFERDFNHVRIHNDGEIHNVADELNARAFTQNNHIGFSKNQYNPDTSEGKRLLAHELAHVSQLSADGSADGNTIYRETWNIDDSARTVERGILVQLIFENTWTDMWNGTGWDSTRKNTFRSNFESSIENTFNSSNVVLNPPAAAADVLSPAVIANGYKPRIDIQLVPDGEFSTEEDWEVDVSSNPTSEFRTSRSSRSYGTLDEADNTAIPKSSSAPGVTQIPSVHEFGHFIGLDHPGHGLSDSERSSGASEYGHSGADTEGRDVHGPTDLMGGGMGLRPFYFDEWAEAVDDHIASLRRQRTLEELQRAFDEFFRDSSEMGDFPVPDGPTRFG